MNRICVATSDAVAYYELVSRLRKAGLQFESVVAGGNHVGCDLVLTTKAEMGNFGARSLPLEALQEDPGVFRGQILSKLAPGRDAVYVGVDPGVRIGLAVYCGRTPIAFDTLDSTGAVCAKIGTFTRSLQDRRFVVRIGDGNPLMAEELARMLGREAPVAVVEIVDEKGTSGRTPAMKGIQGDQRAASKIAFRKGEVVSLGRPRSRV